MSTGRIAAVREVLGEIEAGAIPEQLVFTKADAADAETLAELLRTHPGRVSGLGAHRRRRPRAARPSRRPPARADPQIVELRIPYERGDVLPALHREGDVLVTVHDDTGMRVRARLPDAVVGRFADLVTAVDGVDGGAADHR